MLLLMFRTGETRYAIDTKRVVEVVPRVDFRSLPHAPAYLIGLLGYRGKVVPVIDFSLLVGRSPCREVLSSRVILTEFTAMDGRAQLLGLLAENVSRVYNISHEQFMTTAMALEEAPYLGAVLNREEGLVQLVVADKLLSVRMQKALFGATEEPA